MTAQAEFKFFNRLCDQFDPLVRTENCLSFVALLIRSLGIKTNHQKLLLVTSKMEKIAFAKYFGLFTYFMPC